MRITTEQLKHLIEVTWKASAPKRMGLPDVTVDAESSNEAGENASMEYMSMGHRGIDPFTISVEPMKDAPLAAPEVLSTTDRIGIYQIAPDEHGEIEDLMRDYTAGDDPSDIDKFLESLGVHRRDRNAIITDIQNLEYLRDNMTSTATVGQARDLIDAADSLASLLKNSFGGKWDIQ